jgi:hypothetical protein
LEAPIHCCGAGGSACVVIPYLTQLFARDITVRFVTIVFHFASYPR